MTTNDSLSLKLEKYFNEHFEEIFADLSEIISIESVAYDEPPEGEAKPFGNGSAAALEWGRKKGEQLGLKVKTFDGYAVSLTYGENPELGILSHLDTVPAGEGWNYPPFACTIENGNIYGRGTIDDKGPSVAVLWAVKALQELDVKLSKGFRIIFGGNEEGGCADIEHYQKYEPFPPMVFTPDGSFPVLNCEKGMLHLNFTAPFEDDEIEAIYCNNVINAVPDLCTVDLKTDIRQIHKGTASHASRPENGVNAVTAFLNRFANMCRDGMSPQLMSLAKLFPFREYNGKSCGLGFSDPVSGEMTCALTQLWTDEDKLYGGIDIRFPIDRKLEEIVAIVKKSLSDEGFETVCYEGMQPHHVSADSPLVKILLEVYEEIKGEKGEPIAEGGITYVHNTEGGVAFGAEFPDEKNNMHGADEHISLETFKMNFKMYAYAIAQICK